MAPGTASGGANKTQSLQECHICLEELRQDLSACACGHVFHHPCILQALQVSAQCPICRRFAAESDLVGLFLELPGEPASSPAAVIAAVGNGASCSNAQVEKLSERVSALVERLKWQKKQFDTLGAEMKRVRSQSEQLLADKQALLQRVAALEANKSVLVNKVAKYQMELSRQAEATRQMTVNQSIISYLDTCDSEAMEEEIQNPRELIIALKKACKFRHDQYQKVVKEKARLKAMLQNSHHHHHQLPHPPPQQQQQQQLSVSGKGKLKSGFGTGKRHYAMEYAPPPHPLELKKRKTDSGQVAGATSSSSSALVSSPADLPTFTPMTESAGFRANAYSDVSVRPVTSARSTLSRSNYNPSQYGAYNMTPASEPPVQASSHTVCRRGYDETGKLTNFFIASSKDAKRGGKASDIGFQHKSMTSVQRMQGLPQTTQSSSGVAAAAASQQQRVAVGGDRREFPLTNWLRKD